MRATLPKPILVTLLLIWLLLSPACIAGLTEGGVFPTLSPSDESTDQPTYPSGTLSPQSISPEPESGRERLANVTHWLYLIGANPDPEMIAQIAASDYDLVVLDFIPSQSDATDYPMAEAIAQLHQKGKLVIAYIDIGEAEDYRTYWQKDWRVGNPRWITGADPDGWEGNFPVAFWYTEWRTIWLGEGGMLEQILEVGFDGVYLDWISAYQDENVVHLAEQDGVDPLQEIIRWVGDISQFVKTRCPACVIIAQNAAELIEQEEYAETIDALAQEQTWFDGGVDNEPEATALCREPQQMWTPRHITTRYPWSASSSSTSIRRAHCTPAAKSISTT
jgi:cysteinyl-tRNA synthetase